MSTPFIKLREYSYMRQAAISQVSYSIANIAMDHRLRCQKEQDWRGKFGGNEKMGHHCL